MYHFKRGKSEKRSSKVREYLKETQTNKTPTKPKPNQTEVNPWAGQEVPNDSKITKHAAILDNK